MEPCVYLQGVHVPLEQGFQSETLPPLVYFLNFAQLQDAYGIVFNMI